MKFTEAQLEAAIIELLGAECLSSRVRQGDCRFENKAFWFSQALFAELLVK
jgi:hypothetical protein